MTTPSGLWIKLSGPYIICASSSKSSSDLGSFRANHILRSKSRSRQNGNITAKGHK